MYGSERMDIFSPCNACSNYNETIILLCPYVHCAANGAPVFDSPNVVHVVGAFNPNALLVVKAAG